MKAVIQLVSEASVTVDQELSGSIGKGLTVLLGVGKNDTEKEVDYLAAKIVHMRIFADGEKLMNRSLLDENGEMLIVSQFTLFADCRKGRRPSYSRAAPPEQAERLYNLFVAKVNEFGVKTATGRFRTSMQVALINSGPITIILDSEESNIK